MYVDPGAGDAGVPGAELETKLPAAGSVSVTVTPVAVAALVFVTFVVYAKVWPANAPRGPVWVMASLALVGGLGGHW